MRTAIALALGLLLSVYVDPGTATDATQLDSVLTIAYTPSNSDTHTPHDWQPLMRHLSAELAGYEFTAIAVTDTDALRAGVSSGGIDFLIIPPVTSVILERVSGVNEIATLSRNWNGNSLNQFAGTIIARSDRFDIRTLQDLAGKSIMGVAEEGAGCWLVARRELLRAGITPKKDCARVVFSSSRGSPEVVRAVRDGDVDAGAVRSGVLEKMIASGEIDAHEITVLQPRADGFPLLHTTPLYPEWSLAKAPHVTPGLAGDVLHVLLHIEPDGAAAIAGGFHGWTAPLDYSGVQAVMTDLGHPLFKDEPSAMALMRAYWKWLVAAVLGIAVLLAVTVYTSRINLRLQGMTTELRQSQQQLASRVEETTNQLVDYDRKLARESTVRTATEGALRESEHKYRQLVDLAQEGIWVIDAEGITTFVNPSMGRMLGYTVEEMLGQPLFSYMDEQSVTEARRNMDRRRHGIREQHDFEFLHRNGHTVFATIETAPITDDDGNFAGAVAGVINITERKHAEHLLSIRAEQHEALAEIGRIAVSGGDLDEFLHESVEVIARAARVDLCKILQLDPDRKALLLKAGVGWKEGLVGRTRVPATADTQAGYTLQSKTPVVSTRLDEEHRFSGPSLLREHGVVSGVSVTIGHVDSAWGILGAHTRTEHEFWRDDVSFLSAAANLIFDAVRRSEAEASLRVALQENEGLRDRLEAENTFLREEVGRESYFGGMVGESNAIRVIAEQIDLVAPTVSTVLILGESGTGKELVAREIHARSPRSANPIVAVNCASIPENLYESEFFGHVAGAFTGAIKDRTGRFDLADNSTLFLDEIAEIPLHLQSKLLRVLQEGQYERVGSETTRSTDIRLVAATNRDLKKEVEAGRFREDLYYRLNVFPIEIPPLRSRPQDMAALTRHFLTTVCRRLGREVPRLTQANIATLQNYDWPGNVRELQNVIERAVITLRGDVLRFDVPSNVNIDAVAVDPSLTKAPGAASTGAFVTDAEMRRRERANTINALERAGWQVFGANGAAALLGIKPTTLASRMKRMGIEQRDRGAHQGK